MGVDDRTVWPATLIVVPCLNESADIGARLDHLLAEAEMIDCRVYVADGGSTDGTLDIVTGRRARCPRLGLVDNPGRLQSAAVNLVVDRHGKDCTYLIRVDVHGDYTEDYCRVLLEEAERTQAQSVVVAMRTVGRAAFQSAVASAQNSFLGTGGSRHRMGGEGRYVDHGHHALMRVDAFEAVGGYDESFSHNEDAELDERLRRAGGRIWMTGKTHMVYYPRKTAGSLFRQYLNYGSGRARNVQKHRTVPKLRQALPLLVAPAVVVAVVAFFALPFWLFAILAFPAIAWAAICLVYGAVLTVRQRSMATLATGLAAMTMHFAWSLGFWRQVLSPWTGTADKGRAT